jgi:hypothetical protein
MGGFSGASVIVNPPRSTGFGDPFRNINAHSTGKVTCQIIMIPIIRLQTENKLFLCCSVMLAKIRQQEWIKHKKTRNVENPSNTKGKNYGCRPAKFR